MLRIFSVVILLVFRVSEAPAQPSLVELATRAKDSIVSVRTIYMKPLRTPAGIRMVSFERNGVGVIVHSSGLIVTNTHTIINAPHIFVVLKDGSRLPCQVAHVSPHYDFSFLRVQAAKPLKPLGLADSSRVQLGADVAAIGTSALDTQSILAGQVVSLAQNPAGKTELLEINLNLHKGDSGGPILDRHGRLLGIVVAKQMNQERSSFAIPSQKIWEELRRLLKR